ncbi:MAG: hypothetical protein ABJF67_00295 [Aurantimonas coralicida]
MNTNAEQDNNENCANISVEELEAMLDRLREAESAPAPVVKPYVMPNDERQAIAEIVAMADSAIDFVNPAPRKLTWLDHARRLMVQGVEARAAVREGGCLASPSFSKQSDPSPQHQTTSTTPKHTPRADGIAARALKAKQNSRPKRRRHLVEDSVAASWHHELARLTHDHDGGEVVAVTLRLSPDIERQARQQAEPLDWIRRRINRRLKDALGYVPPAFWALGIKSRGGDALHVHGEIILTPDQQKAARAALKLACGLWDSKRSKGHQVDIKPVRNAGWSVYCFENAEDARRAGITGKTMSAASEVKKAATSARKATSKGVAKITRRRAPVARSSGNDVNENNTSVPANFTLVGDSGLNHRTVANENNTWPETESSADAYLPQPQDLREPDRRPDRGGNRAHARPGRAGGPQLDQARARRDRRHLARHHHGHRRPGLKAPQGRRVRPPARATDPPA